LASSDPLKSDLPRLGIQGSPRVDPALPGRLFGYGWDVFRRKKFGLNIFPSKHLPE
jgi:hypothetical protein